MRTVGADTALFDALSGQMIGRRLNEVVRRPGDKITPGINRPGFSTFTVKSGKHDDEGTAFKAKTADGKTVPIIMRGQRGEGGSAEAVVPGGKRVSLTIDQASKLKDNISMYDLADVPKLIASIRGGKKLPENVDLLAVSSLLEKSPPGWSGTVKAMKKHMPDDKAFALAWSMHKKGAKPHYKPSKGGSTSEGNPEKKAKYQDEGKRMSTLSEALDLCLSEADGDQDDDLTFIADPAEMQRSIEQKLGLANMRCPDDVLSVITSMYDEKDVPAAVYAAAAGMARAEQNASASAAKVLNQLKPSDVAAALIRSVQATGSASVKDAERWWTSEIGKFDKDRGSPAANNITVANSGEVQPYIDSLSTEDVDSAFDASIDELPIGYGALSSYDIIGIESGYRAPEEMRDSDDRGAERSVDRAAAVGAIRDGVARNMQTAPAIRNSPDLPGVGNRINPNQYTAESLDTLDFATRLRMAEAYDRFTGNAPDMSQDELVDAEAYRALLIAQNSDPMGKATPIAAFDSVGKVEIGVDDAFDAAVDDDE